MICYDNIFPIAGDADFEREALRTFRRQAVECAPYAEYLRLIGVEPSQVERIEEIPMLPIELQNDFIFFMEQVDKSKYHGESSYEMEVAA